MRLRKLLLATGAIVAAGAMSLAPTAMAATPGGPIVRVSVGGNVANATHPINLTMKSAQVIIKVYGINTTINCTAGTASGVVRGGTLGVPTYEATINNLSLNCPSIFPGTTVTMSAICDIDVDFADNVHTGLVDTGTTAKFHRVAGKAWFTNHATPAADCVQIAISNGCQFKVGNFSDVAFDEAIKTVNGVNYQDLYLSGSAPTIKNPNAACLGAVGNGQTFTLNAVFNVQSPDGLIDFQNP